MIITLCGSARFETQFHEWSERLTFMGHLPIGLAVYPSQKAGEKNWYTPEQKRILDLVHLRKIDIADAILVLNVGGYVGDSTRREIEWAGIKQKGIYWLETVEGRHPMDGNYPIDWLHSCLHP